MLRFELVFEGYFALVEPAEFVDFILILPADFHFVRTGRDLVIFG